MGKKEFVKIQKELQKNLGRWKLEVNEEVFAEFSMGCFFDKTENLWKVYINNEKGRHRIRFATLNENEAFDELLSMVNFEIENNKSN